LSVSKIACKLQLKGKGSLELALYRHMAPLTVNSIVRVMPIVGRVSIFPRTVCVLTGIRTGVEKQRYEYSAGDATFMASSGMLCFMLGSTKSDRPLNPVGKIESGIEVLEKAGPGDTIEIRLVQEAAADQT
jgi:hypothetical protein